MGKYHSNANIEIHIHKTYPTLLGDIEVEVWWFPGAIAVVPNNKLVNFASDMIWIP